MPLFRWRPRRDRRPPLPADPPLPLMPIVVGSPRSGTTLLRLMLDAHSELAIPPETGFLKLGPRLRGKGERLRERFFRAVVSYPESSSPAWPDFEIPEEAFREAVARIDPFTVPDGYRAFYRLYAARFGKSRWGDKTPLYCMELDTIRRLLPEARFVHVIRDGRDVALSLRKMWFSPGREMKAQAAYWRRCVLAARRAGGGRPDYLEVRYEDLILDTRETLGRICAHIGLDFDEAMLSYHLRAPERLREHKGRSRPDGTPLVTREERLRQQARTTELPDPSCVFAWKEAMSMEERKAFQAVAGDLLEELGYEV
ncbi:MAG TPA: sulfotransferase [Longimicrobiaceae bacterium]|nr:sulfotransferase [Longimicrobiaceae bacterium]